MPLRFVARRVKRFFIYRVLSLDDTPHRIALGVAIGIFITWTPTIGLQMILTLALSALLGANKFVGIPFVWISNPFTLVPIYGPNYFLGCRLLGGKYAFSEFMEAVDRASQMNSGFIARVQGWWEAIWPILVPLWAGSIIIGASLGLISYAGVYYGVKAFRRHRHRVHPEFYDPGTGQNIEAAEAHHHRK